MGVVPPAYFCKEMKYNKNKKQKPNWQITWNYRNITILYHHYSDTITGKTTSLQSINQKKVKPCYAKLVSG